MTSVTIRVPATSANLGAGFDAMGLALDWCDELTVRPSDRLRFDLSGEGADQVPRDESHLVVATLRRGLRAFGHPDPDLGLVLSARNTIPHSRGLGSSAAAIAAGHGLAWALTHPGEALDLAAILELVAQDEGHPDNAAAVVHGGVILAWPRTDRPGTGLVHLAVDERIRAAVWVPGAELRTATAREVLPASLALPEVIAQAGTAALFVHALAREPDELLQATRDWVHQRQRGALMPDSLALMDALRARGVAAFISGAGPTVMALGTPAQLAAAEQVQAAGFTHRQLRLGAGMSLV